ncbi:hypothetical protein PC116_g24332 [Phytophthora cactorum]|uniref:Uncharacterized protein n=1 Tax=Phytophthora cactorum TaxID=29920 RepID=A0A8T1JVA7_9STRA|nr:hypothetical protein PC114_g21581 [Phytophthora cactorum]KAG2900129.1 hypothetical protein PC117_g22042 [Phytophthora cactorum]KAG2996890.1 hypothetical protein PC120_g21382 [Phytophthora cactorum]KAG3156455.1 hypothetical protein PC128_g21864 [Phytophthora cactorum]KAG4042653.1 hypothetical protein PC123_g21862 [Phytophthora cactorum]
MSSSSSEESDKLTASSSKRVCFRCRSASNSRVNAIPAAALRLSTPAVFDLQTVFGEAAVRVRVELPAATRFVDVGTTRRGWSEEMTP